MTTELRLWNKLQIRDDWGHNTEFNTDGSKSTEQITWPERLEGQVTRPGDWRNPSHYSIAEFMLFALHRLIPISN